MIYKNYFKRLGDVFGSIIILLVTFPFLVVVFFTLLIINNGGVFFYQARPGKNTHTFKIIKFKSMTDARDSNGDLLPDNQRLTAFGKFIRKTSLDELPQLINVLKGDMSMIGPRPLRIAYIEIYNKEQMKRHLVRPGITGLAQVNGRNNISWTKKFEYDTHYVHNITFKMDWQIFIKSISKIFQSSEISSASKLPTQPFNGKN